ncbi:MAG: amidohydrolase [Myxococcota bacterium]
MNPSVRGVLPVVLVAVAVVVALYLQPDVPPERGGVHADLILERARLVDGTLVSVAVADGKIVGVGRSFDFASRFDAEEKIDAAGGTLVGGYYDAHAHVLTGGLGIDALQLGDAESPAEVIERVRAWAAAHPEQSWIRGRGWVYSMFSGGLPSRELLDQAVADRPVILEAFDGHALWGNSRAIELAGQTAQTPDPPGGQIVRDSSGTPSGVFLESAKKILEAAAPPLNFEQQLNALADAVRFMLERGVTRVDDMVYRDVVERVRLYRTLEDQGRLPVKVRIFPVVEAETDDGFYDTIASSRPPDSSRVSIGGVKLFIDGVIESKTALMLEPYATGGGLGQAKFTHAELVSALERAAARNLGAALHAIGDGAVRLSLDAIEALTEKPDPVRLEHIEVIAVTDVARMAKLGVIASVQPRHADPGGPDPNEGVWARNLGEDRLARAFPWKSLLRAGVTVHVGTDWPVVDVDPLPTVAVALSRQSRDGEPKGGWYPEECLSLEETLVAYQAVPDLTPGATAELVLYRPGLDLRQPKSAWAFAYGSRRPVVAVLAHGEVHRF